MKHLNPIWISLIVAFVAGLFVSAWWVYYLKTAHSTFEKYYAFRGCAELVEKTDTYGTCKLKDGKIIKLVKFNERWFLDGDLPTCDFGICW